MNRLSGADRLANRYSVMRHGQSKANVRGLIVSRIEHDRSGDYGLSERGREQALAAARGCGLPGDTVICSSDFARAQQTAEIVRHYLGASAVVIAEALRERCFGEWEGSATENYARVWAADADADADADQADSGPADGSVEPVHAVLDRTTAFIAELERRYTGRDILLVSHGDTLQILQAGFLRTDPSRHRSLPPLETAEIRALHFGPGRLVFSPGRVVHGAPGADRERREPGQHTGEARERAGREHRRDRARGTDGQDRAARTNGQDRAA